MENNVSGDDANVSSITANGESQTFDGKMDVLTLVVSSLGFILFLIPLIGILFLGWQTEEGSNFVVLLFLFAFIVIFAWMLYSAIANSRRTFTIGSNGLTIQNGSNVERMPWGSMRKIEESLESRLAFWGSKSIIIDVASTVALGSIFKHRVLNIHRGSGLPHRSMKSSNIKNYDEFKSALLSGLKKYKSSR